MANWYSPDRKTPEFFKEHGYRQVLCGYYDNPNMKANIARWMEVTEGVDGVIGIMYTTWRNNFEHMEEFFRLVDTYPAWLGEGVSGPTGINEI